MRTVAATVLLFVITHATLAGDYTWPTPYTWPEVKSVEDYVWPSPPAVEKPWDHLILYFTQGKSCPPCEREEVEVFPLLREKRWKIGGSSTASHIRIIDIHENPECAASYKVTSTPTFVLVKIRGPKESYLEISRKVGFVGAVDLSFWSIEQTKTKKLKEVEIRKPYPLRRSNWTGPDGRHQLGSREEAIHHLLYDGEHRGKFTRSQLSKLTLYELRALHSDDHERRVNWSVLNN